jgi:hypothetical protein
MSSNFNCSYMARSSNSSHFEWRAVLSDTILKRDHPTTIPAKFAFPPPPKTDVPPQKEDKAIATKFILNQPPKITWFSGTDLKSGDATPLA